MSISRSVRSRSLHTKTRIFVVPIFPRLLSVSYLPMSQVCASPTLQMSVMPFQSTLHIAAQLLELQIPQQWARPVLRPQHSPTQLQAKAPTQLYRLQNQVPWAVLQPVSEPVSCFWCAWPSRPSQAHFADSDRSDFDERFGYDITVNYPILPLNSIIDAGSEHGSDWFFIVVIKSYIRWEDRAYNWLVGSCWYTCWGLLC